MQEYMTFTQDIVKSGKFKAGDPLEPTSTATTVRVRNNKTLATDGPFAETKEQLGGYYLVEAKDLDERSRSRRGSRAPAPARLKCGRSERSACNKVDGAAEARCDRLASGLRP
jgi:hypothetical protein